MNYKIEIAGENALIIYFSKKMQSDNFGPISHANNQIRTTLKDFIIDTIVSYGSILIQFDLLVIDHFLLKSKLTKILASSNVSKQYQSKTIEIPVYYSLESGPDLSLISKNTGLSVEEIIQLHTQQVYKVFAIGFAPGFAYLGEVNSKIASKRLSTPRMNVPKGSVAIADQQTAIYPSNSPGGWNIIGLSPIDMFDAKQTPCMPFQSGDCVKFKAISKQQFIELGGSLNVQFN